MSATAPPASLPARSHYERPSTKEGPYKARVVVFVHGIFGDSDATWRYSPTVYWPKLLLTDEAFRDSDVYVASYSSPRFGNTMNLDEVVTNLNNRLVNDEVFSKHREVVFVCHSLGGLIVQRLLLTFRDYAKQVPFIYFFSTPETGAQIANLTTVFSSDPLLKALMSGDENAYLQNLENEWKAASFHIHRFCAYEKKKYMGVLIVDRLSGTRNCDDPPLAINEDHISIVKPENANHDSYVALRNAFRQYPIAPARVAPRSTHPVAQPPIERIAKFAVMIPFDTAPDALPIPLDENPDDPLYRTYTDMHNLAQWGTIPDSARESKENGQITWKANPVSMNDAPVFLGRLLQYYVFASIDNLQRNSLTVFVGYPAEAKAGIEPPDPQLYPDDKLSQMLANNRFFRPFLYRPFIGQINRMILPKATVIEFEEAGKPPEKFTVRYERPNYFKAEFTMQTFAGTGFGSIPKHFATSHASTTMQWPFFVTMRYSVEHRPDDAAFNPDSYAKWLDALYEELSKSMVLADNSREGRAESVNK
jgi:pimeloyl-ACP methyl ester carboxylesterase